MNNDALIWAAEIGYWHPQRGLQTLYVAGRGFVSQPTDTPADTHFMGRLLQPGLIRREMFSDRTSGGASRMMAGEMQLINNDGKLDWLMECGLDGRSLVLRVGKLGSRYPADWREVHRGLIESATASFDDIVLQLRDAQQLLDRPLSTIRYAGDNALPAGVEGMADLKGRNKPVLFGYAANLTPPCVNTSKQVYQVSTGACEISAAYHRGAALTRGTDYTSLAEVLASDPAAGGFRVWPAGGLFRIGLTPAGPVTCDAAEGAAQARHAALVAGRIAQAAGLPVAWPALQQLASTTPGDSGVWLGNGETVKAALDQLAADIGAWWALDGNGAFNLYRLTAPAEPAALELNPSNTLSLERITANDEGHGLPAYRVEVNYAPNYTVQSEVAGTVDAVRAAWLRQANRQEAAENAAIRTAHPLAPVRTVDTRLRDAAAAKAEAARLLALHGVERDWIRATVRLTPAALAAVNLGTVVRLRWPRFRYRDGRPMCVLGALIDPQLQQAELTLWG